MTDTFNTLIEQVYELRLEALVTNAKAVVAEEDAKEALRAEGVNPILQRRLEKLREKVGKVVIVASVSCETSEVL